MKNGTDSHDMFHDLRTELSSDNFDPVKFLDRYEILSLDNDLVEKFCINNGFTELSPDDIEWLESLNKYELSSIINFSLELKILTERETPILSPEEKLWTEERGLF